MQDSLITLDAAKEILSKTEPLSTCTFSVGSDIWFKLDPSWNMNQEALASLDGDSVINGEVSVHGKAYQLTKDTLLEASSACGLSKGYVTKAPAKFITMQLNYWYRGGLPEKDYKFLSAGDTAFAMTRQSLQPFSNLRLVDQAVDGIREKYGNDVEIYA